MQKIMVKRLFIFPLLAVFFATASRGAGVHEHGVARLQIALDGDSGIQANIIFETAADSIYGFEYEAKSAKDRATQKSGLDLLKTSMPQILKFDDTRQCVLKNESLKVVTEEEAHGSHTPESHRHEAKHRNVEGRWSVSCGKSLLGTKLNINFVDKFSRIRDVRVITISESSQKSFTLKDGKGFVGL
jgi:hypothetical protein